MTKATEPKSPDYVRGYRQGFIAGQRRFLNPDPKQLFSCPECDIPYSKVGIIRHLKQIHGYRWVDNILTSPEGKIYERPL